MKLIVTFFALFAGAFAQAGCFSQHLHEAMKLNRARLPRYAKATYGRSVPLSLALLASEETALASALVFERHPHRFLCDAFVSMDNAPAFQTRANVSPGPLRNLPIARWKRDLKGGDTLRVSED